MRCRAGISICGRYRHDLWRWWDETLPTMNFILLNPSTATAETDDPTLLRCVGYARAWGYGGLCITNLFDFRATDPKAMRSDPMPSSLWNDRTIRNAASEAALVVCGWGAHGNHRERGKDVINLLRFRMGIKLQCLGVTKDGLPRHPLYLPKTLQPIPLP
ncbi:MAG: DUF1643 domain-containing protein [Verrucomicrobia bacterium]|nr:DUF1643 domain-containing protein [Verrucomicrobiota bacterium]